MLQTLSGKKVQALVLAALAAAMLAFGLSFAAQQAYAIPAEGGEVEVEADDGNTYIVENISGGDNITLQGVKSTDKSISVPETLGKYTITAIGTKAFKGTKATTVTLPDTINRIEKKAFKKSPCKTLIVKSKQLTKKKVKNCLKGSKVKVVKVPKSKMKKYKKIFTKKVVGKKVTLKAL